MPTNYPVPSADSVREILTDLMGRAVTVGRGEAMVLTDDTPAALADFLSNGGGIGIVCLADLRLANALGAALTMVPSTAVEEAVKRAEIDEPTIENFQEVVNILTRLFNSQDTPALSFRGVHRLPAQVPTDTNQLMQAPRARRNFDIGIDDYGSGKLSILVA